MKVRIKTVIDYKGERVILEPQICDENGIWFSLLDGNSRTLTERSAKLIGRTYGSHMNYENIIGRFGVYRSPYMQNVKQGSNGFYIIVPMKMELYKWEVEYFIDWIQTGKDRFLMEEPPYVATWAKDVTFEI